MVGAPLFLMSNSSTSIIADAFESMPGDLRRAVINEFKTGYQKEMVEAGVKQNRIAMQTGGDKQHNSIEGIGRLRMRIDPTLYHHWGQKLGYACWRDSQFLREVERDNPEVRVKCGGTKLQVGYSSGNKRFSKMY